VRAWEGLQNLFLLFTNNCNFASCTTWDIQDSFSKQFYTYKFYDYLADAETPLINIGFYEFLRINYKVHIIFNHYVTENIIYYVNGTSETFYSLSKFDASFTIDVNKYLEVNFMLDGDYNVFEQYFGQASDEDDRNLQSSSGDKIQKITENRSFLFLTLFILSQLGGLFVFLYIVLG
jgi:hypothetical protein